VEREIAMSADTAPHANTAPEQPPPPVERNIVVFSDGTGQRGGVFFDEARTNVYKLYRATRVGPDSNIDPRAQIAFYDPGLGTQPAGQTAISWFRTVYNFLSQATGLGLTRNIIDCYSAIIRLWKPGDRIYLFGFSRGAYTVRCLASVICYCGIPTRDRNSQPLGRDEATTFRIASHAVKTIYQHVSSPRDAQFQPQRIALARRFREEYGSGDVSGPNEYPFFIGVFDTVAALSNQSSLAVVCSIYGAMLLFASWALGQYWGDFWHWLFWLVVSTIVVLIVLYIYTHLKFAFHLPGFRWWETVHLTTFRQKFYDNYLNTNVMYARHAISIDERRADFARVRWGNRANQFTKKGKIPRFEQIWFAGNHADIGGGYPEKESRLSDIALKWMVDATQALGDEKLIVYRDVLALHEDPGGMQHDETRSLAFRLAGKSDRDPVGDATLHPTVVQRFTLGEVQQFDVMAPYRPEALRRHRDVQHLYTNVPLPNTTCGQRIRESWKAKRRERRHKAREARMARAEARKAKAKARKAKANPRGDSKMHLDRVLSCAGLAAFLVGSATTLAICIYQLGAWLKTATWHSLPLETAVGWVRGFGQSWAGLQIVYEWLLALPLSLMVFLAGFFLFWWLGALSAAAYKRRAEAQGEQATPAQTQA
jgi:uncharacterized protein (DUF2235 family)